MCFLLKLSSDGYSIIQEEHIHTPEMSVNYKLLLLNHKPLDWIKVVFLKKAHISISNKKWLLYGKESNVTNDIGITKKCTEKTLKSLLFLCSLKLCSVKNVLFIPISKSLSSLNFKFCKRLVVRDKKAVTNHSPCFQHASFTGWYLDLLGS